MHTTQVFRQHIYIVTSDFTTKSTIFSHITLPPFLGYVSHHRICSVSVLYNSSLSKEHYLLQVEGGRKMYEQAAHLHFSTIQNATTMLYSFRAFIFLSLPKMERGLNLYSLKMCPGNGEQGLGQGYGT